jgi:hypothetical protein
MAIYSAKRGTKCHCGACITNGKEWFWKKYWFLPIRLTNNKTIEAFCPGCGTPLLKYSKKHGWEPHFGEKYDTLNSAFIFGRNLEDQKNIELGEE